MKPNTISPSPKVKKSPKRRALADITNVVDKKKRKVTDGKQNVGVNIATVKKETEAAVSDVVGVAENSVISVPEKLVLFRRSEARPEWEYCKEIHTYMRRCEETCLVQAKDLPSWMVDKGYRAKFIERLTEDQIWINLISDSPICNATILQEILYKTVSTIER